MDLKEEAKVALLHIPEEEDDVLHRRPPITKRNLISSHHQSFWTYYCTPPACLGLLTLLILYGVLFYSPSSTVVEQPYLDVDSSWDRPHSQPYPACFRANNSSSVPVLPAHVSANVKVILFGRNFSAPRTRIYAMNWARAGRGNVTWRKTGAFWAGPPRSFFMSATWAGTISRRAVMRGSFTSFFWSSRRRIRGWICGSRRGRATSIWPWRTGWTRMPLPPCIGISGGRRCGRIGVRRGRFCERNAIRRWCFRRTARRRGGERAMWLNWVAIFPWMWSGRAAGRVARNSWARSVTTRRIISFIWPLKIGKSCLGLCLPIA